jgi:hypothetical protein
VLYTPSAPAHDRISPITTPWTHPLSKPGRYGESVLSARFQTHACTTFKSRHWADMRSVVHAQITQSETSLSRVVPAYHGRGDLGYL